MTQRVKDGLCEMLAELQSNRLEVGLAPSLRHANEGGCIRVVLSRNADWYRVFCSKHPSGRLRRRAKVDTKIKRRNTEKLLSTLLEREMSRSKYAEELLAVAAKPSSSSGLAKSRSFTLRHFRI